MRLLCYRWNSSYYCRSAAKVSFAVKPFNYPDFFNMWVVARTWKNYCTYSSKVRSIHINNFILKVFTKIVTIYTSIEELKEKEQYSNLVNPTKLLPDHGDITFLYFLQMFKQL